MARVDDYKNAAELSKRELGKRDPGLLAGFSGAGLSKDQDKALLDFHFLGRSVQVAWPDLEVCRADSGEEVPIQQQVLILHYLEGAWQSKGPSLTGEWMAFQDVPDGRFYQDAFQRRAKLPFLQGFGREPERLEELARTAYAAERIDLGDVSMAVSALPMIRAALVLWAGDEEFPPEGNILFDRNTASYLSAEDIAWLSGMIVYPLVGMAAADSDKG
ncbi:MAG: DUF3786 domain-containing protein [Thermodesulfobacteriota bacterium]